jgi:hypothetical protein
MIRFEPIDLPQEKELQFRQWLQNPAMETLKAIIESQTKEHLVKAIQQSLESKDHPLKLDAADLQLIQAQRLSDLLDLLNQFTSQPKETPFYTAKLT